MVRFLEDVRLTVPALDDERTSGMWLFPKPSSETLRDSASPAPDARAPPRMPCIRSDDGPATTAFAAGGGVAATSTTTSTTCVSTTVDYEPLPGQAYTLLNVASGTALGVSGIDGRTAVGSVPRGLDEQWRLEQPRSSGGAWRFRSVASGKYLDFRGDASSGARLIVSKVPRNWKMRRDPRDPGVFRVYVPKTRLVAALENGDDRPGTSVQLEEHSSFGDAQLWRFRPVDMGVHANGDEIVATTTTTTVTKVKTVTRMKKAV
ncbi:hypothetical protein BV25DRAFT_1821639 [Artomyces pyxidatus]|uniref:Uncharacterized protein n=1 Tax=Artomyces pyxidatus TaxID=48021 RepID=A0ACB8TD17_9AGAM|nr:hypothetical protein BV25DRAFT_1821639 [Artomyces pyxidatus]